jgi:hypothetical protein
MTIKKSAFLAVSILVFVAFASCKKLEQSIKRDVIISPAGTAFTIPVISNTNSGQVAGMFPATIDLDAEIRKLTNEFGKDNIRDIKISSLQITLTDPVVEENNLGNFEELSVEISSGVNKALLTSIQNNSSGKSGGINFPVISTASGFKEILGAGTYNYDVRVKARTATTAALNALVTATYTVSLSF